MESEPVVTTEGLLPDEELFAGIVTDPAEVYAAQASTPADALRRMALPQPPGIVKGVFHRGGVYLVYSSPGEGKSLLMADLCYSVALDRPWLPGVGKDTSPGFAVDQCPAVWVDQDNGSSVMDERMAALARAYGVDDAPVHYLSFPAPGIAAARGLNPITKYVQSVGAGLVVFDNLLRVAGVRDENAAEIDVAMGNLRLFAETTGAAVIVIHHRRKDTVGREGDSIRGHSSIEAALDAAFLVTRDEGGDVVTVKCTKARRRPVDTFAALWTYELADDGDKLHTARFWRADVLDKRQQAAEGLRLGILAALEGGPLMTKDIKAAVPGRGQAIVDMLTIMHRERAIVCKAGVRGAKFYSLP